MNAQTMFGMMQFVGGKPLLILRDHTAGRIKVFLSGKWIATIVPAHLLSEDTECVLIGYEGCGVDGIEYAEERTTWGGAAFALSQFQQTGIVPTMDSEGFAVE